MRTAPPLVGALALMGALAIAAVVLDRATAPPDVLAAAPPLRAEEASVWLARRGALTAAPLFGHPDWAPLAADRSLAMWYRHALPPAALPSGALVGVSVHRWHPGLLQDARGETGLDPELVALLLDPPWADALSERCDTLPVRFAPLCDPSGREGAEARVDAWLARLLASGDSPEAQAALDAMPDLGARGGEIAQAAWAAADRAGNEQGRARALLAWAWADPTGAAPALREATQDPGPLVPLVAALELGRLGQTKADGDLAQLQSRLAASGDSVLVDYARRLARGAAHGPDPGEGL